MFHANEGGGREEERIEESEEAELRIIGKSIRDQPREQKCVMSIVTVDRCLSFFERIAKKKAVPNKKKVRAVCYRSVRKLATMPASYARDFLRKGNPRTYASDRRVYRNVASLKCWFFVLSTIDREGGRQSRRRLRRVNFLRVALVGDAYIYIVLFINIYKKKTLYNGHFVYRINFMLNCY